MKKIIITVMLCSLFGTAVAQNKVQQIFGAKNVSNIRIQQHDAMLYVTYDLTAQADIDIYVSLDNGISYRGPLQYVTGAAGKGIYPEKNKILVWDIVKEVGYVDTPNAVIKIVASAIGTIASEPEIVKGKYQPNAFGIEFAFAPNGAELLGLRYTRNVSPRFGFDILKLEAGGCDTYDGGDIMSAQLLSGIRVATSCFGKKKNTNFYSALRIGAGYCLYSSPNYYNYYSENYYDDDYEGVAFAWEWDNALHFKHFFIGANLSMIYNQPYIGLRFGWDIGKRVAY